MHKLEVIPDVDGLLPQNTLRLHLRSVGSDQRNDQIQIRTPLQDEAYATQDPIDSSISTKSVAINWLKVRGLLDQFFVCHIFPRSRARNYQTATGRSVPLNSAHCDREYFPQRPQICGARIKNFETGSSFAASSDREIKTAGANMPPHPHAPAVAEFTRRSA